MKLHIERETKYVAAQCPVRKTWSANKLEFTKNWVVYENGVYPKFVGDLKQANKFVEENSGQSAKSR